jgi:lipase maturation factor 1
VSQKSLAPSQPLLTYDGKCRFCTYWVRRWKGRVGSGFRVEPYQEAASWFSGVPAAEFEAHVVLIEPSGRVSTGAEAVFRALSYGKGSKKWLFFYENVPFFRQVSEGIYGWVSRHRSFSANVIRLFIPDWKKKSSPLTHDEREG